MQWLTLSFLAALAAVLPGCGASCDEPMRCDDEARIEFTGGDGLADGAYDIRVGFDDRVVTVVCNNAGGRWDCGDADVEFAEDAIVSGDEDTYEADVDTQADGAVAFTLAIRGNFHPLVEIEEPRFAVLVTRGGTEVARADVVIPFADVVEWCGCGDVEVGELALP